ncbi:MAG: ferritin-like domain-containing protein [Myxococcales bacterium]|nr:ferritin-like domain-containing protein [Myxococcales bacterium]
MAAFDIDDLIDRSGAVQIDDLDYEAAARIGVTDDEAVILRYMADTETHTIIYMRDLLAGHSVRDPDITAFLSVWVYEELWHGRAIDRVLVASGREVPRGRAGEVAQGRSLREHIEAIGSWALAAATHHFIPVHMAWGALNEFTAAASYTALSRRTENPAVRVLCRRIAQQERKHFAFYYHQAEKRLEGSRFAQMLCGQIMQRFWDPVGDGVAGHDSLALTARVLFNDPWAWNELERAEHRMRQLPGMGRFDRLTAKIGALLPDGPPRTTTEHRAAS